MIRAIIYYTLLTSSSAAINFCSIGPVLTSTVSGGSSVSLTTGAYTNNAQCSYLIYNPYGLTLSIAFTQFSTEQSYDYLSLSAGSSAPWSPTDPPSPLLPDFNGGFALSGAPSVPFTLTTSEPVVGVFFNSDSSGVRAGVSLTVTAAAGGGAPLPNSAASAALAVDVCAQARGVAALPANTWAFLSTSSAAAGGE